MPDPIFDQLSATTLAEMERNVVYDNFFVEGAWQQVMRHYAKNDPFSGGLFMQIPFMYDRVNGGAYPPGSNVEVVQKQILAAMGFPPRAYKEDIAINKFQVDVINSGPAAAVDIYDAYMENAVQACSTDINIDFYNHGQAAASTIAQDRSIYINGADEALNDGVNPGWMGNVYANYGGQARNGAVGNVLNATPIWAGDQAGGVGQLNPGTIVGAYLNCVQPPDTGLCNKAAFQYLWQREEAKQRFTQESDPRIGAVGFKFLNAFIHVDKLAPSTKFGALLPTGLSQTTSLSPAAFTTPALTAAQYAISNYPASTSCKPGEPFFWFRLQDWKIRASSAPEFNRTFTPEIRSQNNPDLIVRWFKAALNVYTESPRDNSQIVGFGF